MLRINKGAVFAIANMYVSGNGVEQNLHKAAEWYQKAVDMGDKEAVEYLEQLKELGYVSN